MISLLLALALGWQDNPPPKAETPKKKPLPTAVAALPAQKQTEALPGFDEIKKAYDKVMERSTEIYVKAKTEEEREAAAEKSLELFQKEGKPFAERAMVLVRTQAADKKAIPVLVWVLQNFSFDPQADEAADLMIKHHLQSKELFEVAQRLSGAATDWSLKVMKILAEKAEAKDDRAKAKYYLAQMYHNLAEGPALIQGLDEKTLRRIEGSLGKGFLDRLKNIDSQTMDSQAEKLLEDVSVNDADVKMYNGTLGEAAKNSLFEIRNLSIGKPAPEIIGEDIDGKPMKLSDYKGKVVVLDFWGFW